MGRKVGVLVLLSALMLLSLGAHAAEPGPGPPLSSAPSSPRPATVHLDYQRGQGAAGCVSEVQLARDVEARLGREVFVAPGQAELTARVRAQRLERGFVVQIELFDEAGGSLGRRELSTRAAHCSSLDDSLALVLALAADMSRQPAPGPAPPPVPAGPAPHATPSPPAAPLSLGTPLAIPETTHAPRLGVRLRPSLGAALVVGLVPSIAPGLELGLELRAGHFWPALLRGAGFAEQRQASSVPSKSATFAAQTLMLGVCPWTGALGRFEASMCAMQCLGRIRAQGEGFDQEQRDDGWALHVGAGLGVTRSFGPLFVGASATLLVPVVRRRYFFTDDVDITLFEQSWLAGLVALRLGTEI